MIGLSGKEMENQEKQLRECVGAGRKNGESGVVGEWSV